MVCWCEGGQSSKPERVSAAPVHRLHKATQATQALAGSPMATVFNQPEHLTKDRLKSELKRQGVTFSPSQPKNYYVQLYREQVLNSSSRVATTRRQRSEFSSDEELSRRSAGQVTTLQLKLDGSSSSFFSSSFSTLCR